ncbi:unnamed protein product [Closterium sp. NIES-65]|nr:unnamed protein product [Closterium sp. NIES-65]
MPEGIRKYYVGLLNLILLFLIAWQASPYATRSYDYRGVTGGAGGKGMMTLGKDVPVRSSAATDAKEASLDSSEWSLSDKLVAGRPAAVAGDATGSQARGSGAASDSHGRGQGVSGEAGLHREGAAADGGKGSAKAKERREHVCYTSSAPWKGHTLVPRNHLSRRGGGGRKGVCAGRCAWRHVPHLLPPNAPLSPSALPRSSLPLSLLSPFSLSPSAPWKGYHLVPRNHLSLGGVVGGKGCARCVGERECVAHDLRPHFYPFPMEGLPSGSAQPPSPGGGGGWEGVCALCARKGLRHARLDQRPGHLGAGGFGMGAGGFGMGAAGFGMGGGGKRTDAGGTGVDAGGNGVGAGGNGVGAGGYHMGADLPQRQLIYPNASWWKKDMTLILKGPALSHGDIYPNASWWKKDMTLILKGPALSHGDVRCLDPPACSQLDLTYRLWDVGQYKPFLGVGCANLQFAPNYKQHLSLIPFLPFPLRPMRSLTLPRAFPRVGCANLRFGPNYKQRLSLIYSLSVPFPSRVRLLSPLPGHS